MVASTHSNLPDEVVAFRQRYPQARTVDLIIPDVNGVLRGKRVEIEVIEKVFIDGVNLPGSLFGADINGETAEATGLGFDIGDADQICRVVPGTLTGVPWHPQSMGQVLLSMFDLEGKPYFADPQHVLAGILERFTRDLGFTPVVAVEMEFFLIDRQRAALGAPQPPISPVTGERERKTQVYGMAEIDDYSAFLGDVADACEEQNIPADTAVAEYAPGQYEVNLHYTPDAHAACTHAILLKRIIKQVAWRHGMDATFMAKPYDALSGSGTHVHVSLLDKDGRNVFSGPDAYGSDTLRHAIGGLMATMVESMALFAPNANSYRRFRRDSFVPLTPAWAFNNRTTALRIPAGPDHARRIEHRVAGADVNPFLLTAAVLAGMHHGLTQRLDPGPPVQGNAYAQLEPCLPDTWGLALQALEEATIIPQYFGEAFVKVYLANKYAERERFSYHVSPLEHEWYLLTV
ncbi:glutamine synthetase family protein [Acidihalobacter ferrooxydans]|uniref:Glutamine synthetase n=1 Tax=Acidihalobacter ferrooxydans TaxID=1765967 RepID=A0A1P8UDE1_9GAMM|nr:glutamine synthetase family protein [Acidihalobacter ferrooxydans]APZ41789.1 glutamine synthetase [Acidihalobacter ferrooxydans]